MHWGATRFSVVIEELKGNSNGNYSLPHIFFWVKIAFICKYNFPKYYYHYPTVKIVCFSALGKNKKKIIHKFHNSLWEKGKQVKMQDCLQQDWPVHLDLLSVWSNHPNCLAAKHVPCTWVYLSAQCPHMEPLVASFSGFAPTEFTHLSVKTKCRHF